MDGFWFRRVRRLHVFNPAYFHGCRDFHRYLHNGIILGPFTLGDDDRLDRWIDHHRPEIPDQTICLGCWKDSAIDRYSAGDLVYAWSKLFSSLSICRHTEYMAYHGWLCSELGDRLFGTFRSRWNWGPGSSPGFRFLPHCLTRTNSDHFNCPPNALYDHRSYPGVNWFFDRGEKARCFQAQ